MPKRRANGEGTIRKRKDGRWEGRYTAGHDPETGKAISKNVLGHSQAEVLEKLKDAIALSAKTSTSKYSDYTVGQWAQTWYDEYAKPNVRESTALYYKNYIDNHIVRAPIRGKVNPLSKRQARGFMPVVNG